MLSVLLRRANRNCAVLYSLSKNRNNKNCCQSLYFTIIAMPPKRKNATLKVEPEDSANGGGEELDPPPSKSRKATLENKDKKVSKKAPKAKLEKKEDDVPEKRLVRPKRTTAKPDEKSDKTEAKGPKSKSKKEDQSNGVPKAKTTRKKKVEQPAEPPKSKGRKKDTEEKIEKSGPSNSTVTKWDEIDFKCSKNNGEGQKYNLKISCWNIGGLKSWIKKDCLKFLEYEDPDILCMQETKCSEKKLPDEIKSLKGYEQYWLGSNKEGYAGVGLLTKKKPIKVNYGIGISVLDEDGRCVTAEFEEYYIICVYVPNAGRKLVTLPKRLDWNEAFKDYVKDLDNKKPVIVCGDMNVSHNEIDLARPANNTKNAGFTKEEREGMTDFLQDGYIDTFRKLYPEKIDAYTFWTYMANARAKNVGWRLDYFIASERIMDKVCDSVMRSKVLGSDHCPITLFINI